MILPSCRLTSIYALGSSFRAKGPSVTAVRVLGACVTIAGISTMCSILKGLGLEGSGAATEICCLN